MEIAEIVGLMLGDEGEPMMRELMCLIKQFKRDEAV